MSSIISCPFWDKFLPLSRQLGVEVEVELGVDLEQQVVVDREIDETMNLRSKIM